MEAIKRSDVSPTDEAVQELAEELVDFTRALVRIPTETHPPQGDEGAGQRFLAEWVSERFGWPCDQFLPSDVEGIESHPGWWAGLDYSDRPNVVIRRKGAAGGRSLILNGHMDVVPAGPADQWRFAPYDAVLEEGTIYGRGAADMKGGIASMIYAVRAIEQAGIRLAGDVIIESVVNEELGGYNGTLACCERGYYADAAIVAEGTMCEICPAHKGGQALTLRVPGKAAHSNAWWRGVSAVDKAFLLKQVMSEFQKERVAETRGHEYFSDREIHPLSALVDTIWSFTAGDTSVMATPGEAVLHFWCDALPGEDVHAIVDRLEARILAAADRDEFLRNNRPQLQRTTLMRCFQGTAVSRRNPFVKSLAESYTRIRGQIPRISGAPFACDAMMFNLYSKTPAVIFGPGDVTVAHAPNEFIEVSQLVMATRILTDVMTRWCGTV